MAEIATEHRVIFQFNDDGDTIAEVSRLSFARRDRAKLEIVTPAEPKLDLTYEKGDVAKEDLDRLFKTLNADALEQKHS